MDRRPKYNRQIVEPPILIPPGYITIAEAVGITSKDIPEAQPRTSGCSPAEHFLRCLLSQQAVDALLQHHTDGQCEPMPYQAWAEPTAPIIFDDGMVPVGGLLSHEWASVRIHEAKLRDALSKREEGAISTSESMVNAKMPPRGGRSGVPETARFSSVDLRKRLAALLRQDPHLTKARALAVLRDSCPTLTENHFNRVIWPEGRELAELPRKAEAGVKPRKSIT